MSEKPQAQPQSESPEEIPNNSFMPGKKFNLPDGTVIEVAYDNGDRTFGVTETDRDGKLRLLSMSEGDLRGLNDSLLMTDEEVSENYQRNMAEGADEDTKPSGGFDVDAEVAQAQSRLDAKAKQLENDALADSEAKFPSGHDEAPIAVADSSETAEPEPTGEGGPQESSVKSGEPEVATSEGFDDIHSRLARNLGLDANEAPADNNRAGDPEDDFDAVYGRLANSLGLDQEQASSSPEQEAQTEAERLRTAWQELVEQYGAMSDRYGPEGRALKSRIDAAFHEFSAAEAAVGAAAPEGDPLASLTPEQRARFEALRSSPGGPTPLGEAFANAQAEQAAAEQAQQQAERQRRIDGEIALIRNEVDGVHGEALRVAMDKYKVLKADSETEGKRGRTEHERLLKEAEDALFRAKMAYETEVIRRKHEAGLYDGDEQAVNEASAEDLFTAIRRMDKETRAATNLELEKRKEHRGFFGRAKATMGRFFMGGGKFKQSAKGFGVGLGTGAGVAIGATLSGVGWPVTAAVLVAANLGVRSATTTANLDKIRAENKDDQGQAVEAFSAEAFQDWRDRVWNRSDLSLQHKAATLAGGIFEASRKRGYEQADRARRESRYVMGGFAVGTALGGIFGHGLFNPDRVGAASTDVKSPVKPLDPANTGAGDILNNNIDTSADIGRGAGGQEQMLEFFKNNGVDTSKISGSELLDKWREITSSTTDVFTANGGKSDLYMMSDGYYGIDAPNSGNAWNPSVARDLLDWGRNLTASR